jgi:hypothetical protein
VFGDILYVHLHGNLYIYKMFKYEPQWSACYIYNTKRVRHPDLELYLWKYEAIYDASY